MKELKIDFYLYGEDGEITAEQVEEQIYATLEDLGFIITPQAPRVEKDQTRNGTGLKISEQKVIISYDTHDLTGKLYTREKYKNGHLISVKVELTADGWW